MPKRLLDAVRSGPYSEFHGNTLAIDGGGLKGARYGAHRPRLHDGSKPRVGTPKDVQYSLKDGILTRAEFVPGSRGKPSMPVHIAHFDSITGKRFSVVIDRYVA